MNHIITDEQRAKVREALKKLTAAAEIHGDQFKPDNNWHKMSDAGTEALAILDNAQSVGVVGYEVHRAMCEPALQYRKEKGALENKPLYAIKEQQ